MQNYNEIYQSKFVSAVEAVSHIKDGDRVAIGHACGEPQALTRVFAEHVKTLRGIETIHMIGMGESAYCREEYQDRVRHNSLFVGNKNERNAVKSGRGDYTPRYFSRIPSLFADDALPPDVVLVQVSSPDQPVYAQMSRRMLYASQ